MRLFFRFVLALALCFATPSVRADLTVNNLTGFDVGATAIPGGATPTLTFVGCTFNNTNLGTYTFAAQNVSTAGANRHTIVGVIATDSATSFNVSSLTIGGDAATEVADQGGTGLGDAALYIMANAADTAEDIVVTWSESVSNTAICVWAAYDLSSATPVGTNTAFDTAAAAMTLSVNTSANGIAVGVCQSSNGASFTWTGLTERADAGTEVDYSGADVQGTAAATPRSIICDPTTTVEDSSGAAASFL